MNFGGFAAAGTLAAGFALAMLFQRTLYSAALCLLGVLLQIGVLYFLAGAQLLAMIQVLVYAGAIMVLIVVAAMAAPPRAKTLWIDGRVSQWLAGAALVIPAAEAAFFCFRSAGPTLLWPPSAPGSLEHQMAQLLFGPYALMTETVGVVILVSVLALVLADAV